MSLLTDVIDHFLDLLLDAAAWLLLGLFIAGLLKSWLRTDGLARQLGQEGWRSSVKASLIGAPLPLCSCGAIPVAISLRRAGASRGATSAFLVATPQTGPDSIALTWAMLGPVMALIRPLAAIITAIAAGLLTGISRASPATSREPAPSSGCCSNSGCIAAAPARSRLARFVDGQRYAFVDIFASFLNWLAFRLVFAALLQVVVPESRLLGWGDNLLALLVMALIGLPMYICATAATPIAVGLIAAGMAPGTALVFLLTGPVANVATLGLIRRELGGSALIAYLVAVLGVAIAMGALLNAALTHYQVDVSGQLSAAAHVLPHWLSLLAALLLVMLALWHWGRMIRQRQSAAPTSCGG